jgi:hypothetical protein
MPKRRKAEPPPVEEVLAPFERRARRESLRGTLATLVTTLTAVAVGFFDQQPFAYLVALALLVLGALGMEAAAARRRLAECRALIDARRFEPAVAELKALVHRGRIADEASYLIALAYDRQGAHPLALRAYAEYLARHARGVWAVEARLRLEELEAPLIKARETAAARLCPFCKSTVGADAPVVECAACGTAHHAGCYEEQGGCAVYGCESKTAKARARARD